MDILQMSLAGAVMILAVMAVRAAALNRLPKRTFVALWAAALLRLLLPWSPPSALSVYSLAARLAPEPPPAGGTAAAPCPGAPETEYEAEPDAAYFSSDGHETVPNAVGSASGGHGADSDTACPAPPLWGVSSWTVIWLGGALACAAYFTTVYRKCRRQFAMSLPVEQDLIRPWPEKDRLRRPIRVRQSDLIASPLTYGILRPVIILPKTAGKWDKDILDYVLTHEYIHIQHCDAVIKLAVIAAVCIHWFNPFVWVMFVLANRDIELSCDEAVLRRFGYGARSSYASALILMEEQKSGFFPFAVNFSKNPIEERIKAIMKLKKISTLTLIAAAGAVICVTAVFATSAEEIKPETYRASGSGTGFWEIPGDSEFPVNSKREAEDTASEKALLDTYAPFGVTYRETSTADGVERTLYYNGKPVNRLVDNKPDGGVFTFGSSTQSKDGPVLHAVYENGKLTGVVSVISVVVRPVVKVEIIGQS